MSVSATTGKQAVLVIGSGTAGSSILNALSKRSDQFTASLLVRPTSLNDSSKADQYGTLKQQGIQLVAGDVGAATQAELSQIFASYSVVIGALSFERYGVDQLKVVQACIDAGVQRYLPTAYGVDGQRIGKGSVMAAQVDKRYDVNVKIQELCKSSGKTAYTYVDCSLWSEWLLKQLGGIDWKAHTMTVVDSWDNRISTTTIADFGEFVAAVLLDDTTKNQTVYVASDTVSMTEIADQVDAITGKPLKRETITYDEAVQRIKSNPQSFAWYFPVLIAKYQHGVAWSESERYKSTSSFEVTSFKDCAAKLVPTLTA